MDSLESSETALVKADALLSLNMFGEWSTLFERISNQSKTSASPVFQLLIFLLKEVRGTVIVVGNGKYDSNS